MLLLRESFEIWADTTSKRAPRPDIALHSYITPRLLSPCCPVTGTRMRYELISHKPPSKQLTKLCKLTSSDGPWDNFFVGPAFWARKLLWHARLEYQCSLLPLMFPQSIFFFLDLLYHHREVWAREAAMVNSWADWWCERETLTGQ